MGDLRRAAWERQRGLCAATGLELGEPEGSRWDLHHRLAGQMGGGPNRDRLSNLVCLLSEAHNMGSPGLLVAGVPGRSVHGDPGWSRPLGLLLSQGRRDRPEEVPVLLAGVGWVFLGDDGGMSLLAAA